MTYAAQEASKEAEFRLTTRAKATHIRAAIATAILARVGQDYDLLVSEYLSDLAQYEELVKVTARLASQSEAAAAFQILTGNMPNVFLLPEQDCNNIRARIKRAEDLKKLTSLCRAFESTISEYISEDMHSFMRAMQFFWQAHGRPFNHELESQAASLYEEYRAAHMPSQEYGSLIGTYCISTEIGEYRP
ncbi:hypothetical protein [Alcanivorax quisquiliarum]|uniref:Uncharacterized protein n=1 Tax=Alcanivorax quisquiliarum TaxID=2933565 RepID=A0ABT0E8E0_9GAMM|nr:hypothetical protein [Alcanivorax quisquiliarum]MCK0538022.1 hypothetical protein [Alcanivorax quisquiliarum]